MGSYQVLGFFLNNRGCKVHKLTCYFGHVTVPADQRTVTPKLLKDAGASPPGRVRYFLQALPRYTVNGGSLP